MNNPESVYYYIAEVNPSGAEEVLSNYGFIRQNENSSTTDQLANSMYSIVQSDGEPALRDIMSIHPDKAMIVELFGSDSSCSVTTTQKPAIVASCNVPTLPIGKQAKMYSSSDDDNKSFFSSPTNCLLLGVGVIAVLAVLKS